MHKSARHSGGKKYTMSSNQIGFVQIIKNSAKRFPDKLALVYDGQHETYSQFLCHVNNLSCMLREKGIRAGDRVAIISENCIEYLEAEFAIYQIGAIAVKINWRMTTDEISYILKCNDVIFAFLGDRLKAEPEALQTANPNVAFLLMSGNAVFEHLRKDGAGTYTGTEINSASTAVIVHTSGTTGRPKFVHYTHADLMNKVQIGIENLPFTPKTRFLMIEQLFHIASMRAYMTLAGGGTLVLIRNFKPEEYLHTMERENVNSLGMVPSTLKMLMDTPQLEAYDLGAIEYVNYSTSSMPYPLIKEAIKRFECGFYQIYGMTEMLGFVTMLTPEDHLNGHIGTVGRPIGGYELRIEKCDGTVCSANETGEILIHGPVMMHGYLNNPELTQQVLTDGWYHTKDLGFLDEDGYLHVCGRKDDLIISGGENIYPQEILNVLYELRDDIREAAVYGVSDPIWGQAVWASIVLHDGSALTPEQLREYCKQNLANYKVPKGFDFRPQLPRTATDKIDVKRLAQEVTAHA